LEDDFRVTLGARLFIFESFSFGVPVLASNVEGIAELINEGENGYTFATEDAAMLLQKLRWCAAHRAELELLRVKTGGSLTGLSQGEYVKTLEGWYQRGA
jgi:glycosyltransferase involved in cell wall biosynthesis